MALIPWIQIGFLPVTLWDVLDIVIVAFLFYRIYKLLRGSVAFYILLGLLVIYVLWWVVSTLEMNMLNLLLSQFVNVGVIMLLIIFQPEVRKFLLVLGSSTPFKRGRWLRDLFGHSKMGSEKTGEFATKISEAVFEMAKEKTGALIVFTDYPDIHSWLNSGIRLEAQFSPELLKSIFQKNSPLHDGATVIHDEIIHSAGCVLPISKKTNLPTKLGLRHRAGIGVTEDTNVQAIIVSEENGKVAFSEKGNIHMELSQDQLVEYLTKSK
ncbi:MAG TPA: diadenylate cyclase CdaA [Saprospiraceae bacterium]|nr:diadenylate cyclase CdaA [Saprospiraceae bacterium]